MAGSSIPLPTVDEVKITLVTDNSFDLLMAGTEVAQRFPLMPNAFDGALPIAEHGFSALIRV